MDAREKDAFRDYVAARSPALLRMAYLITGDQDAAEELQLTSLAKVYLAWSRLGGHDIVDAYARRVLVDTHSSRLSRRRLPAIPVEPPPAPGGREATDALDERLWAALRMLPARMRAAVVLRYHEDLSEADVADALGSPVGSVRSQLARALAKLRDDAGVGDDPRAALPGALADGARG